MEFISSSFFLRRCENGMKLMLVHIFNECGFFFVWIARAMYVLNNEFSANASLASIAYASANVCYLVTKNLYTHKRVRVNVCVRVCVCTLPFLLIEMQRPLLYFSFSFALCWLILCPTLAIAWLSAFFRTVESFARSFSSKTNQMQIAPICVWGRKAECQSRSLLFEYFFRYRDRSRAFRLHCFRPFMQRWF